MALALGVVVDVPVEVVGQKAYRHDLCDRPTRLDEQLLLQRRQERGLGAVAGE